jgi:hypothetical protein
VKRLKRDSRRAGAMKLKVRTTEAAAVATIRGQAAGQTRAAAMSPSSALVLKTRLSASPFARSSDQLPSVCVESAHACSCR